MKLFKIGFVVPALALIPGLAVVSTGNLHHHAVHQSDSLIVATEVSSYAGDRYRLESSQSKFIAHAKSGGLLWFKGHEHLVAVREFGGEAQFSPDQIDASALQLDAKAASMVETSRVFTDQQKQIIDRELREIVLQPDQFPDITFHSNRVSGQKNADGTYDLRITGNLTLHGVSREITIPTKVSLSGNDLRAVGAFSIDRSDFKVKATSAVHGLIRVRDKIDFEFDILAHRA